MTAVPRSRRGAPGASSIVGVALVASFAWSFASGCADQCCTIDSLPIHVSRAPLGDGVGRGGLLAFARAPGGGTPFKMVVDTGSPLTILAEPGATGTPVLQQRGFDLLDAAEGSMPVRARFRDLGIFTLPLGPVGDAATLPSGVIGGDLLHAFSVEIRFRAPCPGDVIPLPTVVDFDGGLAAAQGGGDAGVDAGADGAVDAGAAPLPPLGDCSSVTFWPHQGASLGFLEDAGYAVLRFAPFGGGETTATTTPGFLGLQAPVTLPATRVVFRTCAAPPAFSPDVTPATCCTRGAEISPLNGVDLSLLFSSGVGPLVLSQSAWTRVAAQLAMQNVTPPPMTSAPLLAATWPTPIAAMWTTLPRFALVDGFEPPSTGDEGPCVDLSRARRLEWVSRQQYEHPDTAACVQPCDTDPSETGEALNSAAYVELGGDVPVAVVDDAEPYLQALRFDIRPEGPDIDGVLGAAAMGASRVEVDYLSDQPRAIFSCEPGATRDACFAGARCPRLPDHNHEHLCFGLPAHGLSTTCAPSGC
jgi:hypothetical protein